MPQTLEVIPPTPVMVGRVRIETRQPVAGSVEIHDEAADAWVEIGRFRTTPDQGVAKLEKKEATRADRLRLVIEAIDERDHAAVVESFTWQE